MRRATFLRAITVASFALAIGTTSPAFAQGSSTATAEHLFNEGLAAMKRNDFVAACEAFAGSNEADPSPGTQINLALCNEKQGKLATAWGWYGTAASTANQKGQKERAELARAEAAKLEPKLHKLVISVKFPVDGLTVTRDGVKVPAAVLGREDPVDPGEHVVEVTAPKKKSHKQKIMIAASPGVDRMDVPALEDAPEDKPPVVVPPGGDNRAPVVDSSSTQKTIGYVVGGVGILTLLAGGAVQLYNLAVTNPDYKDTVKESEARGCGSDGKAKPEDPACGVVGGTGYANSLQTKDDARNGNQTAAIVLVVGGVVLIAGGLVLILTAPSGKPTTGFLDKPIVGNAKVTPILGSGNYGLGLSGSF